jgi:hypothetical protein
MTKFLHVTVAVTEPPFKTRELELAFNNAEDWVRYSPNCWILRSDEGAETWLTRVRRAAGRNANVFIADIDTKKVTGFLPGTIWDWFEKNNVKFSR